MSTELDGQAQRSSQKSTELNTLSGLDDHQKAAVVLYYLREENPGLLLSQAGRHLQKECISRIKGTPHEEFFFPRPSRPYTTKEKKQIAELENRIKDLPK